MTADPHADKASFACSQSPAPAAAGAPRAGGAEPTRHREPDLGDPLRQQQGALAEELIARHGSADHEEDLQDAHHHLAYLASAMTARAPELYTNYVAWAKITLVRRGLSVEDLARHLEITRTLVQGALEAEAGALATAYIDTSLARLPAMPTEIATYLKPTAPHAELAREYLHALLCGQRHVASENILRAVGQGVTVKEIYLHVLLPAQYEVGRLWQLNELSVAQEHYCTAAAQLIMSQLYPYIFASERRTGTLVSTCVAGGLHEIGLRMVTDFFEMDGWNTFYLGANMPARAVVETVTQRQAHLLCISAATSTCLRAAGELIQRVRADPACRNVKVLVGGLPFQLAPELWRTMNADGCASSAQEALVLAKQWIAKGSPHDRA
jgi:MerR family transcriptional regulator, light-induced transcriptional regulator